MKDYAGLIASIKGLAEDLQVLNQTAVREYTPIVEAILLSGSRDARQIEHTLDGLLSFCGYEPALQLYKKLCRHYFTIDPAATAEYVYAYREMWDSGQNGAKSGNRLSTASPSNSKEVSFWRARLRRAVRQTAPKRLNLAPFDSEQEAKKDAGYGERNNRHHH